MTDEQKLLDALRQPHTWLVAYGWPDDEPEMYSGWYFEMPTITVPVAKDVALALVREQRVLLGSMTGGGRHGLQVRSFGYQAPARLLEILEQDATTRIQEPSWYEERKRELLARVSA